MSLFSPTSSWWFIQNSQGKYVFVSFSGLSNGRVGFIATTAVYPEAGVAVISVIRTLGSAGPIQIHYATADGTGVNGVDYTGVSGTLTWADKDLSTKTITVPLIRTSGITDVTFTVNLTNINPFNFTISPATLTVTIHRQNNGEVDWVGTPYQKQDPGAGSTTLTLQVQRFNGFKGAVGCSWHTTDGTAIAGLDYTAASGTLSWADAESGAKNVVVTILGRAGSQGTRSFTVTIDTPTGGVVIGTVNIATATIVEGAPITNPVANGSIPQWLFGDVLGDGGQLVTQTLILAEELGARRTNVQFAGILGQKIGTVIGFAAGTSTGGGGTDPTDGGGTFTPTPVCKSRIRRMNYANRL